VAELTVGFLVFLATGTLGSTTPAHGPAFEPTPVTPSVTPVSRQVDDLLVTLDVKPNQPGQNIALLQVVSTRRAPPPEVMRVIVHLTYLGQDIGVTTADALETAPGVYQLAGDQLSLAGPWQVDVVVRRMGMEDTKAGFQWAVLPLSLARPVIVSNRALNSILTRAATLLLVCTAMLAVVVADMRRRYAGKSSVAFGVATAAGAGDAYQSAGNHDPDADNDDAIVATSIP
jgi:hypothetical protein